MDAQSYHPALVSRAYGLSGMRKPKGSVEDNGAFGKPVVITTGQAAATMEAGSPVHCKRDDSGLSASITMKLRPY